MRVFGGFLTILVIFNFGNGDKTGRKSADRQQT